MAVAKPRETFRHFEGIYFGVTVKQEPYVHSIYGVGYGDGSVAWERGKTLYAHEQPLLWPVLKAVMALLPIVYRALGIDLEEIA